MKKIILILIAVFNVSFLNAQTDPTYEYNSGTQSNKFILNQNYPDPFNDYTFIEFSLTSENYVKIYIKDNSGIVIETLVDGEVDYGVHSVVYKPHLKLENGNFFCYMDIINEANSETIYSVSREMQYEKGNKILFKKK